MKEVHLTHYVFEVKLCAIAIHVGKSLALLFVEKFKFVASHNPIGIKIKYFKPILDALLSCFVLNAVDEPTEISKSHFLRVLKATSNLRKHSLNGFSGKSISRVLRQLLFAQQEIVVRVQFPKLYINHIEVLVAEEVLVLVDISLCLDIENALQNLRFFKLPIGHLIVIFSVGCKEHPIYHADGVPVLELWGLFQKFQAFMYTQNLLKKFLEVFNRNILLGFISWKQIKSSFMLVTSF